MFCGFIERLERRGTDDDVVLKVLFCYQNVRMYRRIKEVAKYLEMEYHGSNDCHSSLFAY